MARKRRQNPEAHMLQSEADDAIITSGAVMDEVYIEYAELDNDLSVLAKIEAKQEAKGKELSKEARARRRAIKERMRQLDRLIAAYTNRVIKQAKSRLKEIKASPLAKLHKRNIATVERDIFKLENMVKRKGSDVRLMANSLIGGLVTLEDSMGIKASMGSRAMSKAEKERENIRKLFLATYVRWDQVKKHARNHDKFFLRGSEVFHKKYGSGIVIDNDGRKITVKFEGVPYKEMTKASLAPGPVMWVDAQLDALRNKFKKGRAIAKSDIQRIVAKIVSIHNHTKPRKKLKTYSESKRALEAMIGKIETRLSGDKMDKATVDAFLLELEDFHNRIPARMKSEWAKVDQRQWATDVSKVRKALVKLKRKANPCVGFHFHGKDAGELLKAVEESNTRQRKGVKKNPGKKKTAKSNPNGNTVTAAVFKVGKKPKKVKSVWSATEIAATVGGTKREFVPVGDDGYMVFAKKPLRHENERNDEATTTAGKRGHRPEIFGTAVLVPLSHRDEAFNASIGRLSRYGESGTERNPPKKKVAKKKVAKKATRKTKPEWQKLIDKCRKLWDHYCERPSKKRLKPVIEHLEKMKASTSKKVADERKSCLRIANKEARRLKLK